MTVQLPLNLPASQSEAEREIVFSMDALEHYGFATEARFCDCVEAVCRALYELQQKTEREERGRIAMDRDWVYLESELRKAKARIAELEAQIKAA